MARTEERVSSNKRKNEKKDNTFYSKLLKYKWPYELSSLGIMAWLMAVICFVDYRLGSRWRKRQIG